LERDNGGLISKLTAQRGQNNFLGLLMVRSPLTQLHEERASEYRTVR
jgi:hypothetical protein